MLRRCLVFLLVVRMKKTAYDELEELGVWFGGNGVCGEIEPGLSVGLDICGGMGWQGKMGVWGLGMKKGCALAIWGYDIDGIYACR